VITAWIVVTVVSKSATRALIETFIADWSSTMTNWAMANATRGIQSVFDGAPVCAAVDAPVVTAAPLLGAERSTDPRRPSACPGTATISMTGAEATNSPPTAS
jgi:hypothetical protein